MLEWMSLEEPFEICVYTPKVFFAESTSAKVQLVQLEAGMERLKQISTVMRRGGHLAKRLRNIPQGAGRS